MATDLKYKLPLHYRLLGYLIALSCLFWLCFEFFQYHFKIDLPLPLFIGVFTLFLCMSVFLLTRKLGISILRLREFVTMAEKAEHIESHFRDFRGDELGEISNKIISLYDELGETQSALSHEHKKSTLHEQEQSRIKKQLTQNISHELKTPVSSIQGYLETILNNPSISAEKRTEFIEKSYAQTSRLSQLLQDISIITRMDEASEIIEKELLCLSDFITELLQDQQEKVAEKGFKIVSLIPQGLYITGNRSLLHSIFSNLIENATAYSVGDKITLKLVRKTRTQYFFSFSDNGIGLEEQHLSRIFERFYRIDKGRSRKLGGTGLGLSIVKNAVVLHNGTINAQPNQGGGLEFIFSLKKNP